MNKKYFILIGVVFILGISFIITENIVSHKIKTYSNQDTSKQENNKKVEQVLPTVNSKGNVKESKIDNIVPKDIPLDKLESNSNDKNQIFFKNIEKLYDYLRPNQVDEVKIRIQAYINDYLPEYKKIKQYEVSMIEKKENDINFSLIISNSKIIGVTVTNTDGIITGVNFKEIVENKQ